MEQPYRPNVNLRFDRPLYQRLAAEAKANERSLVKECVWRLRQSVETPQPDED